MTSQVYATQFLRLVDFSLIPDPSHSQRNSSNASLVGSMGTCPQSDPTRWNPGQGWLRSCSPVSRWESRSLPYRRIRPPGRTSQWRGAVRWSQSLGYVTGGLGLFLESPL